jgi:hypothetical protein
MSQTQQIDPSQPVGVGEYPITALIPSNIQTYTNQAEFLAKTGKNAPSWNPALPLKGWVDTAAPTGTFAMLTYNTAHLDKSFQHPVVTQISVPNYLAGTINLPPDSGPFAPSTAGEYLTPIRALLPNEKLVPRQMGLFDVVNTDIYDPTAPPAATGTGSAGFTDADRATLNANTVTLNAIAAAMGIK